MAFGPLIDPDTPPELHAALEQMNSRLEARQDELTAGVAQAFADYTPELIADPALAEHLLASARMNMQTLLKAYRTGLPLDELDPPRASVDYAVLVARRGIPGETLAYAYNIGLEHVLGQLYEELRASGLPADLRTQTLHAVQRAGSRFVNWMVRLMLAAHLAENDRWLALSSGLVSSMVLGVLRGEDVGSGAFHSATGYSLEQVHLGLVITAGKGASGTDMGSMDRTVREAAAALGGQSLLLPVGEHTIWAWIGLGTPPGRPIPPPTELFASTDHVRFAVGMTAAGEAGFVRTHQQAQMVRELAPSTGPAPLWYGEEGVALVCLVQRDQQAADHWVEDILGQLNAPPHGDLRHTLLTFLRLGSSYVRAATVLNLHRNTVRYRIARALELLPPGIAERVGTDVVVALHVRALSSR